jgi:hypothetical protein
MRTVSAADVLIAGVDEELPAVRELMLLLPSTAYGQVMVETAADAALPALTTPPRVTVTQLSRSVDAAPGDLLTVAVHAWLTEWTPEDPDPDRRSPSGSADRFAIASTLRARRWRASESTVRCHCAYDADGAIARAAGP